HVHPSTVSHCLYSHFKLGYSRSRLTHVFNKTEHTSEDIHDAWLFDYYQHYPLSYLDDAQIAFKKAHDPESSKASSWRIIFVEKLSHVDWGRQNFVFLMSCPLPTEGCLECKASMATLCENLRLPSMPP
ncbi:hypothetical protein PHMEG_00030397, partial [Phytophthora megakarya]